MGLPLKKSLVSFRKELFSIFWMNELHVSVWVTPLLQSDAEIFERCVIRIESASIRRKNTDVLRRQIQNLPKVCFLFADSLFRNFAFLDIYTRAVPFDDLSEFVSQRFFVVHKPAILAISPPHPRLGKERFP